MEFQDAFPEEDIVWGTSRTDLDLFTFAYAYYLMGVGVAYTINPLYESEVRDYLGALEPRLLVNSIMSWCSPKPPDYREKDGYTLEEIDIYGVKDGEEVIVSHRVRLELVSHLK